MVLGKKGRKKKTNPTLFINSVWNLVHRHKDGSFEEAAVDVKEISPRMLRKLAAVAEVVALSPVIGQLLGERRISLEVVSELAGIKDPKKKERMAEIVADMNALDQRQVVRYAKRNPDASFEKFEKFKKRVLTSKDTKERIYMALLPFSEEEYDRIRKESKKLKMSWDGLCMKIIKDWLDERGEQI